MNREPAQVEAGTVVVIGSITVDMTTFSHRLPSPGETILGEEFTLVLGGKGANQAIAASRAGASAQMVACIGDDAFAELVSAGLTEAGVDISHVQRVPGPTGIAHIRVDDSGESDIVMVPLANSALSTAQIDAYFAAPSRPATVLLTQLEIPWSITQYAIKMARAAGSTVILDPAPAATLDSDIWPLVDIVTPNETEASILTGIAVTDLHTAIQAGKWFIANGAKNALITLASRGAVLVSHTGIQHFDSLPVTAIDSTAAGDSFAGYLGAGLACGLPLADAILRAMAAGALAVTKRGASPSIPHSADVAALLT